MNTHDPIATLIHFDAAWQHDDHGSSLPDRIARSKGDAVLLEWGDGAAGLYGLLASAARAQRVLFPGRWFPARPRAQGGFADDGRILWIARGDASLTRLLGEEDFDPAWMADTPRPDEPLALLGVDGDVITSPPPEQPEELRRRAQVWIHKLGRDRVALVVPWHQAMGHPLRELAARLSLPVVVMVDARDPVVEELPSGTLLTPLLWTDFQLDGEHRLPDDGYVPGLRDLLHRGSLLRERTLYERLPRSWRERADAELRALYGWHVNPLLRRAGALLQTLAPVTGVEVEAPLPALGGVCAYLLGLTDQSPALGGDPDQDARALASTLHEWDRGIVAHVETSAWPRLRSRLVPWAEGGLLAACTDDPVAPVRRFWYSGQPLWARAILRPHPEGIARIDLRSVDRRALGWFELEIRGGGCAGVTPLDSTSPGRFGSIPGTDEDRSSGIHHAGSKAIEPLFLDTRGVEDQLPLDLEGTGA